MLPLVPDLLIPARTDPKEFLEAAESLYKQNNLQPPANRELERQLKIFVLRRVMRASIDQVVTHLHRKDGHRTLEASTAYKAEHRVAALL